MARRALVLCTSLRRLKLLKHLLELLVLLWHTLALDGLLLLLATVRLKRKLLLILYRLEVIGTRQSAYLCVLQSHP